MRMLVAGVLGALLLARCAAEKTTEVPVATQTQPAPPAATASAANENHVSGTWAGQIKVGEPVSMFNYVGAESGDFAPMRFRNDSEAGKKILAVCANDDLCEISGVIEWLAEDPPENASAIGQVVRVDSVKRLPTETP